MTLRASPREESLQDISDVWVYHSVSCRYTTVEYEFMVHPYDFVNLRAFFKLIVWPLHTNVLRYLQN